jgi:hypothetical protein
MLKNFLQHSDSTKSIRSIQLSRRRVPFRLQSVWNGSCELAKYNDFEDLEQSRCPSCEDGLHLVGKYGFPCVMMVKNDAYSKHTEQDIESRRMDRSKIEAYARGGLELVKAFWGLTYAQLHAKPADGSWTLHQNAIHMLDSDLIGSDRMKRIACMDNPLLVGYDETGFSNLPGSDQLNAFVACDLFQKNREMTATILRALPDSAYQRTGIHTENGKLTLAQMLDKYVHHLDHHLVFIKKKRGLAEAGASDSQSESPVAETI